MDKLLLVGVRFVLTRAQHLSSLDNEKSLKHQSEIIVYLDMR